MWTSKSVNNSRGQTKKRIQRMLNIFGVKYGNIKEIKERLNGWRTWKKKLQGLEEGPGWTYSWNRSEQLSRKTPGHDGIEVFWF